MSFRSVIDRIRAVIEGRGADGALGAAAQQRACSVGRFRLTNEQDPAALGAADYDRACHVTIVAVRDRGARNPLDDARHALAVVEVRVAYAATAAQWADVHGEASASDQQLAARDWVPRALDDASEIERALTWFELTGADTSPVIEQLAPLDSSITTTLSNGRGLLTRRFELWLEIPQP